MSYDIPIGTTACVNNNCKRCKCYKPSISHLSTGKNIIKNIYCVKSYTNLIEDAE